MRGTDSAAAILRHTVPALLAADGTQRWIALGEIGGRVPAPVARVCPLHVADVSYPAGHPRTGSGPVFAFAAETHDGVVLVDTGIGPTHPLIDRLYAPTRYSLDAALAGCGLRIDDVTAIVNTHLHFDHCGGNAAFPGVPIYVQALEREAAHEPAYTIAEWVDFPGARYELLSGDAEIAPGVSVFATPGHTPGHQSVLLDMPAGRIVVAGQAAETVEDFHRAHQSPSAAGDEQAAASIRRILDLAPACVYFSHDAAWWEPADS